MPHTNAWKKAWRKPTIWHAIPTEWGWVVLYPEKLYLGKYVDIGWGTFINAHYGVELNQDVEIGPQCAIMSESSIDKKKGKVVLMSGVKLGSHVSVMPGVVIGLGTTVGAHSFVKDSLPANCVAFGVPAKIKKELS